MQKLAAVDEARRVMQQGMEWSIWRWLIEKNRSGYQMVNSVQRLREMKAFMRMASAVALPWASIMEASAKPRALFASASAMPDRWCRHR